MKKNITVLALSIFALSLSGQTSSVSNTTFSKTSISLNKTDDKYLYISYFDSVKTCAAKEIIAKNLGRPKQDNGIMAVWEEKGMTASVRHGKVKIDMYYGKADGALMQKVEKMAHAISKTIE
ncbi:hypothetical protein D3C72_1505320 [compost metagenome]